MRTFIVCFSLAGLLLHSACTKKEETAGSTAPASPPPSGKTVTVKGTVTAKGKGTSPETIRMSADAYCTKYWKGKNAETRKVEVSKSDGLKGAVVYLKNAPRSGNTSSAPIKIDQLGCLYDPTVIALQVGQPFIIKNSDSTLHNVHALPKSNAEFNFGMATAGGESEKKFLKPELGIRMKCDVHGWMTASISVFDHPYFALTDAAGNFEIAGVPDGSYVLEAYHPVLGTKEAPSGTSSIAY